MYEWFCQIYDEINVIEVSTVSSVYKLVLSMLLGSVVGYERKRKGQTAGVRTFSLIAMGATLSMILSIYVPQVYLGLKNGDPGRIAAQVITGVGFLGAGAIMQMKGSVRGLTTAAGIWMVAAIGMAVGVGMYTISVFATLLILFILMQIERIEHRMSMGSERRIVRVSVRGILSDIDAYKEIFKAHHIVMTNYFLQFNYKEGTSDINFSILAKESVDYLALFKELETVSQTMSITLANQPSI